MSKSVKSEQIEDDGTVPSNLNVKPGWKDPECPKCGLKLGNRMMVVCQQSYCPAGLNR